MAGSEKGERLGRRTKPLKRSAHGLHVRPIAISPEDGPTIIDAVHKDGRYVVRIRPACSCGEQCECAHVETKLASGEQNG